MKIMIRLEKKEEQFGADVLGLELVPIEIGL
jgi:hypothetical protein